MNAIDILSEAYGRLPGVVHAATGDVSDEQIAHRPGSEANSIAWLVWHISRVIDAQIADLAGTGQVWQGGWSEQFDLPFDESATGYGQTSQDVAEVKAGGKLLIGYFDAVLEQAMAYLRALDDTSLDDVVDSSWDPPVTRAVRLVSILDDALQHAGQAAYIRGLIKTQ